MTLANANIRLDRSAALAWPAGLNAALRKACDATFQTHEQVIAGADSLDAASLQAAVADAYSDLMARVHRTACRHAVRFWNYLPRIHQPMGAGLSRYMVFNAGRLDGLQRAMGHADPLAGRVATASAVGHGRSALTILCLSSDRPGVPLANPRQIDPVKYSARYGVRPPCFARATAIPNSDASACLLVGGTASIRGEASLHARSLDQQLAETLDNLTSLVTAVADRPQPLRAFTALRVYAPAGVDLDLLHDALRPSIQPLLPIGFNRAELCRPELLVEIEGVAHLAATPLSGK